MKEYSGALFLAEPEATMLAQENSIRCIEEEDCLPIGGHSILGIYPPIKQASEKIILVLAWMDTSGFFLDRVTVRRMVHKRSSKN